ncbi:hypothetical protein BLNAU_4309 [Blattamonas nauphoetae]|uniref:Uncharacterized protein n=1 Tax=Blattamonas nauphoetae TaxID=2049346 RepID=A0ABQ9YAC3_9EUKA|nr:hypothetical protein BLNAU_4309 [Blattamonas nauphoetae]
MPKTSPTIGSDNPTSDVRQTPISAIESYPIYATTINSAETTYQVVAITTLAQPYQDPLYRRITSSIFTCRPLHRPQSTSSHNSTTTQRKHRSRTHEGKQIRFWVVFRSDQGSEQTWSRKPVRGANSIVLHTAVASFGVQELKRRTAGEVERGTDQSVSASPTGRRASSIPSQRPDTVTQPLTFKCSSSSQSAIFMPHEPKMSMSANKLDATIPFRTKQPSISLKGRLIERYDPTFAISADLGRDESIRGGERSKTSVLELDRTTTRRRASRSQQIYQEDAPFIQTYSAAAKPTDLSIIGEKNTTDNAIPGSILVFSDHDDDHAVRCVNECRRVVRESTPSGRTSFTFDSEDTPVLLSIATDSDVVRDGDGEGQKMTALHSGTLGGKGEEEKNENAEEEETVTEETRLVEVSSDTMNDDNPRTSRFSRLVSTPTALATLRGLHQLTIPATSAPKGLPSSFLPSALHNLLFVKVDDIDADHLFIDYQPALCLSTNTSKNSKKRRDETKRPSALPAKRVSVLAGRKRSKKRAIVFIRSTMRRLLCFSSILSPIRRSLFSR